MENGYDGRLAEKFSGMRLGLGHEPSSSSSPAVAAAAMSDSAASENPNDSLFQVMKAVEAAEATIKQQVEENNRLRAELQSRNLLLDKLKLDETMSQRSVELRNPPERMKQNSDVSTAQNLTETRFEGGKMNGTIKGLSGGQLPTDSAGFSSPSTGSFSPRRLEGEHDQRLNLSGQGLMPITELNHPNTLWKQDLGHKIQEHEEEIMQLRKHLADYSIKEAQIRNEKHVLEKRIAYMRLAFDQQQQDLVDAASKALSYRQDIIEENIRLTYALQDAQQERSTFVSSLLALLAEYSLQPPVIDAQSIVSNVKVLFKHLQEKLVLTETKLKESQYQLIPWRADVNNSNVAAYSAPHLIGTALATSKMNGLELVPQPVYSHGKVPVTTADAQPAAEWDLLVRHQPGGVSGVAKHLEHDDVGRYSPIPSSRTNLAQDIPTQVSTIHGDAHVSHYGEEIANKQVTFRDPVGNSEMDYRNAEVNQNEREPPANWSSGNPPYTTSMDDPSSSYSPYLPPVLEEPSSSFSEAADDDPLPAIEGLQISGEAYPGQELQASGYSINGTTSCNFEWVRHLEDGSVNYIDGAKQPNYLVTVDDVDTYLALEVQPLDNRKRKGELVKVFANDNRKITFDPEMQNHIEKTLHTGHASYKVLMPTGYLHIWEQAILEVKREAFSIKCTGASSVVITEKFSPTTSVVIPYGSRTELIVTCSGGVEHALKVDDEPDISRDTIVVILRLFAIRAGERRKVKKRSLFFSK